MRIDLPKSTRVIDLVKFASAQGKRLVWRSEGFNYVPHMENAANDIQPPSVTRLRPRLRVVDSSPN